MIEIHHFLVTPCELFPKFTTKVWREGAWISGKSSKEEEVAEKGILYSLSLYIYILYIEIYDGSSKVLFPLLALNRNSMRDAFCFTCKKSYTEDTSKMQ